MYVNSRIEARFDRETFLFIAKHIDLPTLELLDLLEERERSKKENNAIPPNINDNQSKIENETSNNE